MIALFTCGITGVKEYNKGLKEYIFGYLKVHLKLPPQISLPPPPHAG
jgi:hypothetical protein